LQSDAPVLLSAIPYKAGTSLSPVTTLAKKGILEIIDYRQQRDPLANSTILPTMPLSLMPAQAAALQGIIQASQSQQAKPILLYGVTGSGKTEVYLQAIAYSIQQKQQAIVLVPEIALTPQTVTRFRSRFGQRIAVLHSHLSEGERHDEWHRIKNGEADVVIGARSAIFAPVPKLGLVIVDEEHEPSYKQSEAPRYHARDVAIMRAHFSGCPVVIGSATPALESWYNVQIGKYVCYTLPDRADYRAMPQVHVVDMRVEAERNGNPVVFSKVLLDAMHERLRKKEQVMLFLNRRGFASSLQCPVCGYVSNCSSCSVSHTYHMNQHALLCHICGGRKAVPASCPECGDPSFRYAGFGTQRLEDIAKKCFPHATIARMDTDTTRAKDGHEKILDAFRAQKIDILVGTQMIAKGLHFPNVTLVGIMYADMSLHMPDFRAGERTFQLITQVAGRAGRGEVPGDVFIQTYTPHHVAVETARRMEYENFASEELEFRQELHYPPYAHLVCIHFKGANEGEVRYSAELYAQKLQSVASSKILVSDATPSPLAKAKDIYRYQIIMRARSVKTIQEALRPVAETLPLPKTVTMTIDVDAVDLM
jgi:primosomal protein N' (replication factor Y)